MSDTLLYIGNVALTMVAMAMGYRLLLKRETFHGLNRAVLLLCLVLPWILPFCGLTVHRALPATELSHLNEAAIADTSPYSTTWWMVALLAIYCIGVGVMLIKSIMAIITTGRTIGNGENIKCEQGYVLVKSNQVQSPFNWMNYIVMPDDLQEGDVNAVMTHELAHLKKRHTLDLILAEVVLALQWFNPAAWMLRADLQAVHEFEADGAAALSCSSIKEYEEILIGRVTAMSAGLLANGFTEQTLKQRIIMLHKKKSSRKRVLKALYLVAIIAASMVANATTVYTPQDTPQVVNKTTEMVSVNPNGKVDVNKDKSVEYYLDGKRIDGPNAVASSQVKSMEVDKSGSVIKVNMYTTEQPGAKKVARLQTSTTFTDGEGNTTTVSDQGIKYGYEFYVDGVKKASIADIASDSIKSIEVDKQDPDHPKVYVTLKK